VGASKHILDWVQTPQRRNNFHADALKTRKKSTEAWKEYKKSKQNANRVISLTKGKKQKECASNLNHPNHQNEIFRIAKHMVKERQDITRSNCLKVVSGKRSVDKKGIKDSWKEYMEKLMDEENEWDHRILPGVKEGPADCIRIDEVAAALKKMKSPRLLRASSRNDTSHSGYWNSVNI